MIRTKALPLSLQYFFYCVHNIILFIILGWETLVNHYICSEFLANHNKDYSVVKTLGLPIVLNGGLFFIYQHISIL